MQSNPDPLYRRWTVVIGSTVGRVAISHPTMVWVVHLDTRGEWLGTRPHPPTARRSGSFANEPLNRDCRVTSNSRAHLRHVEVERRELGRGRVGDVTGGLHRGAREVHIERVARHVVDAARARRHFEERRRVRSREEFGDLF